VRSYRDGGDSAICFCRRRWSEACPAKGSCQLANVSTDGTPPAQPRPLLRGVSGDNGVSASRASLAPTGSTSLASERAHAPRRLAAWRRLVSAAGCRSALARDPVRSAGKDVESSIFTTAAQPIAASRCSGAPTGMAAFQRFASAEGVGARLVPRRGRVSRQMYQLTGCLRHSLGLCFAVCQAITGSQLRGQASLQQGRGLSQLSVPTPRDGWRRGEGFLLPQSVGARLPAIQCEALAKKMKPTFLRLLRSRSRPRVARVLLQGWRRCDNLLLPQAWEGACSRKRRVSQRQYHLTRIAASTRAM
jgi:hypothetical protein